MHSCGVPVAFRHATCSAKSMCCLIMGRGTETTQMKRIAEAKNAEKGLRNLICIASFYHIGSSLQLSHKIKARNIGPPRDDLKIHTLQHVGCVAEPLTLGADLRELSPHFHTAEHCQHWPIGSNFDGFKNGWNGLKPWLHKK